MKESKTNCENNDNFEIVSARCDSQACFESREVRQRDCLRLFMPKAGTDKPSLITKD